MSLVARPRRSALYVPASNVRAMEKAPSLACDVVIIDLEDAVLPEAKVVARGAATRALRAGGFGHREVVVRINALDTAWGKDDLAQIAAAGPDAVLVPKIRGPLDLIAYGEALRQIAPDRTRLWAMIETVQAALQPGAIAAAAQETRLAALVMGVNDLAREMGARQSPERTPFHAALSMAVCAARAHGLAVIDGVYNEIDDTIGLEAACRQGSDFGFDGKSLIHPSHLEICNRVFSPAAEDVAWARAVVLAFDDPGNAGKGALRVDGRLAERLHRDQAIRLLAIDEAIAAIAI